jgi:hypothetical protein
VARDDVRREHPAPRVVECDLFGGHRRQQGRDHRAVLFDRRHGAIVPDPASLHSVRASAKTGLALDTVECQLSGR